MAIDKVTSASITTDAVGPTQLNEASNYAFTGTVTGAGESNTPYFQAYRGSSTQSISAGSWTKVQINTEIVDSANAYDNSSNYRFTPQTAGKYYIYGQVTNSTSTDMDRTMSGLYLNGSAVSQTNTFSSDSSSAHTATIVDLNGSSDYVEMYGDFGVTSNIDLQNRACFFGVFLISTT